MEKTSSASFQTAARIDSLGSDRGGVTALEYGIIASILGLVLLTIFYDFGSSLTTLADNIGRSL
jgi:Flp pilus assembly pilin Flp